MTGPPGTRSCSLIYRDKLGARPGRSELIYLLVSLEQYTAENRDGPWELITRAGLPVVSSHLADDAAMRNQAGRRVVIKGSSRCRTACLPPGQFNMRPQACIFQPVAQTLASAPVLQDLALPGAESPDIGVEMAFVPFMQQADLCIAVLHWECSLLPRAGP